MTISGTARAVAAAAALTLTALAVTGPAHATRQGRATTDPLVGAPTVGACTTLTPQQGAAVSDHSTVVDCTAAHTAEVSGVVKLPKRLTFSTATAKALFAVVAEKCGPKVNDMLGRDNATRDSSAYSYFWFEPTKKQRAEGARWLSCSVVLSQGARLVKLPTSTAPFLPAGALPDKVARCLNKSAFITTCKAAHAWRATGTFSVAGAYPGAKALNKKANRRCSSRVRSKAYRWTYKDKATWNLGDDHVVVCYTQTAR
jgi:putative regulator of septum formation